MTLRPLRPQATTGQDVMEHSVPIEQARYACAIGAMQTAAAIRRVIPITHCGPGCANKQYRGLAWTNGYQGGGWGGGGVAPSTNASQREVIFGGGDRLQELIEATLGVLEADLFVVVTGCIPDLVGDDVGSVVRAFQKRNVPIVYAETGGFRGNNFIGHEVVTRAIIDQFVGATGVTQEPDLVNVWSLLPYQNTFWRGDLTEIKRLLEGIGLRANVLFGPPSRGIAEWRSIPRARFNLVLSPWLGLATARHLEAKFGQPFLHIPTIPIGARQSGAFLREVGAFAGVPREDIEAFIAAEEEIYYEYLQGFADFYAQSRSALPSKAAVVGDSAYVLALTTFLVRQLGLIPARQIITDAPPQEHRDAILAAFRDIDPDIAVEVDFAEDGYLVHRLLRDTSFGHKPPLLFATSWERTIARELRGALVEVGLPATGEVVLSRSNVGYRGALALIERTYSTIMTAAS
ncbi:Hydrogenase [Rhodovastum atsumiense]|uniref:Hydrogenase n=1 Tax=Rhodovastum atsumiense TaxID=504468 RepID=A0A5M6IWY8_9PROT|nr:nitrogenase component 1 [Rhodovastum atsumiense]KAA5612761.1 hydrogenase [Rhodovastum atsumiense]CAH2602675.1 Hydrogenase [Rhodovastum atsumiense]